MWFKRIALLALAVATPLHAATDKPLVISGGQQRQLPAGDTLSVPDGIDVGATDTTVTRSAAGDIAVEGNIVYRASGTDVAVLDGGTGASTASAARTNLGLGTAAVANTGTSGGTVPLLNAANTFSALTTATGGIEAPGGLQATGARNYGGAGVGLSYTGGTAFVQAYDFPGTAYLPLTIQGSAINLAPSGTILFTANSSAISTAVDLTVTGSISTSNNLSVTHNIGAGGTVTGSNLSGTNTGDQTITLTGDISGSGTGSFATAIGANKVTFAQMAQVATGTILGRTTAATGNVEALTAAQARTVIGVTATGSDTTYAYRANNLSDLASVATARTNLGVTATGADTTYAFRANNLSDLASVSSARTNLGLGTAAVVNTGTSGGTIPLLNTANTFSANQSVTGTFGVSGLTTATGGVEAVGGFQAQGARNYAGAGVGLQYTGGVGFIQAFDHPGAAYLPLTINGSTINIGPSGTNVLTLTSSAISATVTPTFPTAAANDNSTKGATTAFVATSFAPIASPVFTGTMYWQQGAPAAINASATLTIAQILGGLVTDTSTTAVSLTLPTGTLSDAGILSGTLAVDRMFDWYTINLGSASGAVTLVAGTAHTIVGNAVCAIAVTCHWGTRKTAANTFVTYRLG